MNEAFRNDRANELYHICQISEDKGVIFYTVWDYIVFFCLLCTNVRKYKVTLVAATLMLNHIHVAFSGNLSEITNCMRTTLSSFSLEYNSRGGTCILHFKKGLNKSQKSSGKKIGVAWCTSSTILSKKMRATKLLNTGGIFFNIIPILIRSRRR